MDWEVIGIILIIACLCFTFYLHRTGNEYIDDQNLKESGCLWMLFSHLLAAYLIAFFFTSGIFGICLLPVIFFLVSFLCYAMRKYKVQCVYATIFCCTSIGIILEQVLNKIQHNDTVPLDDIMLYVSIPILLASAITLCYVAYQYKDSFLRKK